MSDAADAIEAGEAAEDVGDAAGDDACCFVAGTPVQMANGTTEPIEKVKVGDIITSRDPATGKDVDEPVLQLFVHPTAQIVDLHLSDGETLKCTPDHRFFVQNKGLEEASDLLVGDQLTYDETSNASVALNVSAKVSGIDWEEQPDSLVSAPKIVYNFEVANTHTYFVGTEHGGVWVHNDCGSPHPIIALGRFNILTARGYEASLTPFAQRVGATTYNDWGGTPWEESVQNAMDNADEIHFNMDGVSEENALSGNPTNSAECELGWIMNNENWFDKTTFHY